MKRIYALIVMLLAAIPCMAQIDIATLDGKTPLGYLRPSALFCYYFHVFIIIFVENSF